MTRDAYHTVDLVLDTHWLACLRASGGAGRPGYLSRLLARAQANSLADQSTRDWPSLLGELWQRPLEGWSSAAFSLASEAATYGALAFDEPAFWWRADPVHLLAAIDHVRLAATGASLSLGPEDVRGLVDELQGHLRAVQLDLLAPTPTRWYLRSDRRWQARGFATSFAAGRDLRAMLATGQDATNLLRLVTECQMLLADSATNEARVQRALPPINSLWIWGGGIDVQPGQRPPWAEALPALVSTDPELRGAWQHASRGCAHAGDADAPPNSARPNLTAMLGERADLLIALDESYLPPREAPAESLAWLEGVLAKLSSRRATRVRLVAGATLWQLPKGLSARRWWPAHGHSPKLADLLEGTSRADAHPWYSRGLRQPPP